jgi:hypothetical protein
VLVAILAAAAIPYGRWPAAVVVASAISLSITVTNWMAGLVAALLSQPWRQAIRLSIYAFALVALLTPVQYALFPTAGQFLNIRDEKRYVTADHVRSLPATVPRSMSTAWLPRSWS